MTFVPPGSVIGVLGSGQLGRMFAMAARQMGYRVHTYSPDSDTPTGQVADHEWSASYSDTDKLHQFAKSVSVVTFEFENIPAASIETISHVVPVYPKADVLHISQHRLREKTFLSTHGFPVAPYEAIHDESSLLLALAKMGGVGVLKTAGFGYDGKGQIKISSADQAGEAYGAFKGQDVILEGFIDFDCEVSVIVARAQNGDMAVYGPVENRHKNHILDITQSPPDLKDGLIHEAQDIAKTVVQQMDVVGLMCVEMFVTKTGKLLINELAPRPHNSGHYTIDACLTSQFEQQLRAVTGLPLGSPEQMKPAAMVNLLGDLWMNREPHFQVALKSPGLKLHLYGKNEPRKGRKMGHMTVLADTTEEAARLAMAAREAL